MILIKKVLCFLVVFILADLSFGQREKKFFRKDYTYIQETEAFYKIHTIRKTWSEAKRVCAREGSTMFYPENDEEAHAVIHFWNSTQPFHWVFVGISSLFAKGAFETVDGKPVTDVYNNWNPGQPNDSGGGEDCVTLNFYGRLNDDRCSAKLPFICKKNLQSLEWNEKCNIPNLDYTFNAQFGRCYKFHMTPLSWSEAYAVCRAEQSYLAVINSDQEAEYFVRLAEYSSTNKIKRSYNREAVHLGFHNKGNEGWQTFRSTSLEDAGYVRWADEQPDSEGREQCGSMFYNGTLNDIGCDQKCLFICEHDVDTLGSSSLLTTLLGDKSASLNSSYLSDTIPSGVN